MPKGRFISIAVNGKNELGLTPIISVVTTINSLHAVANICGVAIEMAWNSNANISATTGRGFTMV